MAGDSGTGTVTDELQSTKTGGGEIDVSVPRLDAGGRARGLAVDVVAPENLPLVRILGDRVASYLKRRHEEKGVAFHMGATAVEISGRKGAKAAVLSDGTRLDADFVVFGLGVEPATGWLGSSSTQGRSIPRVIVSHSPPTGSASMSLPPRP